LALAVVAALFLVACAPSPDRAIEAEADLRVPDSALLLERLSSGDAPERVRAARAIGRIQSPAYIEGLAGALADERTEVRVAALFALGQLGLFQDRPVDPRAAEAVRPMLRGDDPEVLVAALDAMGKLSGTEVAPAISGFLVHENPDVRAEAAYALFRLRFAPLWRREADEAPGLPDDAVEGLTRAMFDPDARVRFAATYAFSRYADARARTALLDALDEPDARIRLFAVRGLGQLADETTAARLIEHLADEDAGVRVEAVAALDRAGGLGALVAHAEDPSFHVRAAIARALGGAVTDTSMELLRRYENDDSVTVRVAAIDALSERSAPGLLESVAGWAVAEDWRIRAAAARAAAAAGEAGLAAATVAYGDEDIRVRTAVLEGLAGTGSGDAIVTAAIAHDDLALRGTAVGLVAERPQLDRLGLLTAAYSSGPWEDWIEVRESIVDALAEIEGSEGFLRRIAEHDDAASVRGKAIAALGEDPPPVPALGIEDLSPWIARPLPAGVGVDLETVHGTMRIDVLTEQAPVHAAAFLDRVDRGFYDGLTWHRVVSNFVIQGGDPRGDGWGSAGETLRDEINTARYGRGALGMPKAGKDTGGCQLFITHVPTPHLDGNYTVFGQVVSGLDVIDRIEVGDTIVSIRRAETP
jgi:cyclophilin family peptidyl-prolyl cis-trans isomerase/HEAT repeat protein